MSDALNTPTTKDKPEEKTESPLWEQLELEHPKPGRISLLAKAIVLERENDALKQQLKQQVEDHVKQLEQTNIFRDSQEDWLREAIGEFEQQVDALKQQLKQQVADLEQQLKTTRAEE